MIGRKKKSSSGGRRERIAKDVTKGEGTENRKNLEGKMSVDIFSLKLKIVLLAKIHLCTKGLDQLNLSLDFSSAQNKNKVLVLNVGKGRDKNS